VDTIHLDTHVAIWLFLGLTEKLSSRAINLIESSDLSISSMVLLEIQYMYEIKRLKNDATFVFNELDRLISLKLSEHSFSSIAKEALTISWTRDPFDRLIVANAQVSDCNLLTKDSRILKNSELALW